MPLNVVTESHPSVEGGHVEYGVTWNRGSCGIGITWNMGSCGIGVTWIRGSRGIRGNVE